MFEVKNLDGNTIFAVYNEGVRIYVDDNPAKGAKGGFAVGGFKTGKSDPAVNFMHLTPENYFIGHHAGNSMKNRFV